MATAIVPSNLNITATQLANTNAVWTQYMVRIMNGVVHDVTIAPTVAAAIGNGGVSIIVGRYRYVSPHVALTLPLTHTQQPHPCTRCYVCRFSRQHPCIWTAQPGGHASHLYEGCSTQQAFYWQQGREFAGEIATSAKFFHPLSPASSPTHQEQGALVA